MQKCQGVEEGRGGFFFFTDPKYMRLKLNFYKICQYLKIKK